MLEMAEQKCAKNGINNLFSFFHLVESFSVLRVAFCTVHLVDKV